MNVVWLIVIAVAVVIVVAAVVVLRGRSGREPMTPGELDAAKDTPQAVRTPGPPSPKKTVEAEPPRPKEPSRVEAPAVDAEAEPDPSAPTAAAEAPSVPAKPSPPPQLSAEEMRSRVESQIADSQRMLDELKTATAGEAEGEDASGLAGTVEIMEDGLSEVRSLAKRKDWSQAKEKGEALHAQLALMLQSARRERSS